MGSIASRMAAFCTLGPRLAATEASSAASVEILEEPIATIWRRSGWMGHRLVSLM
ncbi:hypothetical protein D3C76_1760670 [compost metagenome]